MKLAPTAEQEREFERKHVSKMRADYIETDVVRRYGDDLGYREKIDMMASFLENYGNKGINIDIGSNTAGEAEVLSHKGHRILATDINEIALSVSLERAKKYRDHRPFYVAADAHNLPFKSEVFDSATAFEVLHHFENLDPALEEIYRVLKPGGYLFTFEPCAWNPYRKISELRFYLMGAIEKSFTGKGLRKKLESAGFIVESLGKKIVQPSTWRLEKVSPLKRVLVKFYHIVANAFPNLFGNLVVIARKPGEISKVDQTSFNIEDVVRCPITKGNIQRQDCGYTSTQGEKHYIYNDHDGVVVLIEQDAKIIKSS